MKSTPGLFKVQYVLLNFLFVKAAFPLIDRLLESVVACEKLSTFGDLVGANDCIAFPEANQVQVQSTLCVQSFLCHDQVVMAQWLARWLATSEVPGSNPSEGDNY